jgi:hypothetical protein
LFIIIFYVFPAPIFISLLTILSFGCFIYVLFFSTFKVFPKVYLLTIMAFVTLIYIFNIHFYPKVLTYQTGSFLTGQLNKIAPEGSTLYVYKDYHSFSMQFYNKLPVVEYLDDKKLKSSLIRGKTFILADTSYVKEIENVNPEIAIIGTYYSHSPTLLSWGFLNPSTRNSHVGHRVLMRY